MMYFLLTVFVFSVMYAIKGGQGAEVFPNWNKLRKKNKALNVMLDGKILSTLIAFIIGCIGSGELSYFTEEGLAYYSVSVFFGLCFAAGWLLSVAPSLGEENGAVGRLDRAWGPYVDKGFGRSYGVKKAVQRGVWMGAVMAAVTLYLPYVYFSLLYVPCVFAGQELYYRLTGKDSWVLSEPLIGAFVFGIPSALLFLS